MCAAQNKLDHAVLRTLTYSDHFDYPLTAIEIYHRLISISTKPSTLSRALSSLLSQKLIAQSGKYYYLLGHKHLVSSRRARQVASRAQFSHAQLLAVRLARLPFVKAIYLTGSLAMANSLPDSDIDFMIITRTGRLWTTRAILTIYTTLFGLRRTPGSSVSQDKLCLNLYLSDSSYALPLSKRSLYTAYELLQAVPIYDPEGTRLALLAANSWIYRFLPNMPRLPRPARPTPLPTSSFMAALESICFTLQHLYMRRKITREYITRDSAFFHPHDPSPRV